MGFSRNICTPLLRWGYRFFLKFTPWISSQIYRDPSGIFHCFCIDPLWKSMFFPQFLVYPPGIPTTLLQPLEFFIDILNRGVTIFFWKSPILIETVLIESLIWISVCRLLNLSNPHCFYNSSVLVYSVWMEQERQAHSKC